MTNNPVLYCCPYCPGYEGFNWLAPFVRTEARREDPDHRYIEQERIDDGRPFLRFGPSRENHLPCRHILLVEMVIDWKLVGWDDGEVGTPT